MTTQLLKNWRTVRLQEIADVRDGTHDTPKKQVSGNPLITSKQLKNGVILPTDYFITDEDFELVNKRSKVDQNDVLIGMIGTVGDTVFVKKEPEFAIKNIGLIKNKDSVTGRFIFFWLNSPLGKHEIDKRLRGTSQKFISLGSLRELEIALPDRPTQKQIVDALSAYDDLIENNTRRIHILEQTAQAIYTEWFINFRFPDYKKVKTMDGGSVFGKIPEGWKVVTLSELFTNVRNSTPSGEMLSKRPYVPIDVIDSQTLSLRRANSWKEAKSSLILFEKGDVLFGAMRPYFHKVAIAPFAGVTRGTCFVLRPKYELAFCALTIFQKEVIDFATANSQGATIPYINWGVLSGKNCVLPSAQVIADFSGIVQPMLELSQKLADTNEQLSNSRNLLLPKLVTGEIRV